MARITRDELNMEIARSIAQRGTCDRARVGARIVSHDGRVIAEGYNGSPPGQPHCDDEGVGHLMVDNYCLRATHAEQNAIIQAARYGGASTEGATLYTTHFPCPTCAKIIVAAGIRRLVYHHQYRPDLDEYSRNMMVDLVIHQIPVPVDELDLGVL